MGLVFLHLSALLTACLLSPTAHQQFLAKQRLKAAKMDEDIAFLTQSTHSALDQREKVKTKFLAAQRDAQQEREQKLAIIKELIQRVG